MLNKQQKYTIKEASQLLNTKQTTIRNFCNSGLVPHVRRGRNGYRILEPWQLDHLHSLIGMKQAGFKKSELKRYVQLFRQGKSTELERLAMLQTRKRQLWHEIEARQKSIDFIERQEDLLGKQ